MVRKRETKAKYRRVVLKLSGEAFEGSQGYGIDTHFVERLAGEIKEINWLGVEIAVVIGGGNIFRGEIQAEAGMGRVPADYCGMLATVINGLTLQSALEKIGVDTRVQTAIEMQKLAEPYIRRRAIRHLEKGRVVILTGGTGNPYFTTDTAAVLRAIEIDAEVILKATRVDGVYTSDPEKNKRARKIDRITYLDALKKRLKVMDAAALSLCLDNGPPIVVFNLLKEGNIKRAIQGEKIGTIVCEGDR